MYCRVFRLMISHAMDGDKQLSKRTAKHLRHCASCRQFYKTCLSLGEHMKREAPISNREVTVHLSEQTLAAIQGHKPKTQQTAMNLGPAVAAACAGLIAVTAVLMLFQEPKNRRPDNWDAAVKAARNVAVSVGDLAGDKLAGTKFPQGWPGLVEEPLAGEIKNLTDDTHSAVRFLVDCVSPGVTGPEAEPKINGLL